MDIRREIKIDPKVELKDYSGPFKPDLRFSDFSREQLAKMYVHVCDYFYDTLEAWANWVIMKYGMDAVMEAQNDIWGKQMFAPAQRMKCECMNIEPKDIESMFKDLQIEATSAGSRFDMSFELPSKDRGIYTFVRCPVPLQFEAAGLSDMIHDVCHFLCTDAITRQATCHNPNIVTRNIKMPPRESADDICCK